MGLLESHKFGHHATQGGDYENFVDLHKQGRLSNMLECYMDDYVALALPTTQAQLEHVSTAIMTDIHDVFPEDDDDEGDPISLKKLKTLEGMWAPQKNILGFTFDGIKKLFG